MLQTLIAQNVYNRYTIPMDNVFYYDANPDPNEGSYGGISDLHVMNNIPFFHNPHDYSLWKIEYNKLEKVLTPKGDIFNCGHPFFISIPNGYIIGYFGYSEVYTKNGRIGIFLNKVVNNKVEAYDIETNEIHGWYVDSNYCYFVEHTIFFELYDNNLVSVELLSDGKYIYRNADETKKWLDTEKGEYLGWKKDSVNSFGDNTVISSRNKFIYNYDREYKLDMSKSVFNKKKNLGDTSYKYIGRDKYGLVYFFRGSKSEKGSKFYLCVYDPWTLTPYFYENFNNNEWNPPRKENGTVGLTLSQAVSRDGRFYFTDCNLEKNQFEIKEIENVWYKEIGVEKRHIGTITTNHVGLHKGPDLKSKTDGYNFENDIVWELQTKGNWSKIRKQDGREGWIETKYINFN